MRIGVIIVAWNSENRISNCLDTLYKFCSNFDLYIVDNNSSDNTINLIKNNYPQANLLISKSNLGFSGGNNLAFKKAKQDGCDYVLLLNDDVIILEDFITPLIAHMQGDKKVGAIGPVVVEDFDRNIIQSCGGKINYLTLDMKYNKKGQRYVRNDNLIDVDYILGAAIFIRTSLFSSNELFDPHFYPAYVEEVDLCFRIKKFGFKNLIHENYQIAHIGSTSASNNSLTYRRVLNNKILFSLKHQTILSSFLTINLLLIKYFINIFFKKIKKV